MHSIITFFFVYGSFVARKDGHDITTLSALSLLSSGYFQIVYFLDRTFFFKELIFLLYALVELAIFHSCDPPNPLVSCEVSNCCRWHLEGFSLTLPSIYFSPQSRSRRTRQKFNENERSVWSANIHSFIQTDIILEYGHRDMDKDG